MQLGRVLVNRIILDWKMMDDKIIKEWRAYCSGQQWESLPADRNKAMDRLALNHKHRGDHVIFIESTPEGSNPFYDKITDLDASPGSIIPFNGIPVEKIDIPLTTSVTVNVVKRWKRKNQYQPDKVRVRLREVQVPAMVIMDMGAFKFNPEQMMFSERFRMSEPKFKVRL